MSCGPAVRAVVWVSALKLVLLHWISALDCARVLAVPPSVVNVTGWPQAVALRTTIENEPTAWLSFGTGPCRQITE